MRYNNKEIKKGISVHKIDTNKFKTNLIAIFLSTELNRENVTFNAVLSSVLRRGCKELKTQEEISKKLEEMYGAEFDCGLDKIGKNHVLKFYIESVNNEYLPEDAEDMIKNTIGTLSEIIFNTLVEENGFKEEYLNQEKENVEQIINAKKDNKARYAAFRCIEEMYKDSPTGLYKYGYVEDLEAINTKSLYEYYKKLIDTCKIDIFVSGNIQNLNIDKIISSDKNIINLKEREPKYVINRIQPKEGIDKENLVEESMDVTQGKLVIGYDVILDKHLQEDDNTRYVGMLYNGILGGSANSKLFQNVREKESLAYTTNSTYAYYSSNIFVNAGIDINNYEKTLEVVKKQIDDLKNGDISDEEIENIKKVTISNIESIDDEQDTEIIYFLGQTLCGRNIGIDEYIKRVKEVTKEQILEFAKKIQINTIYFLKN